MKVSILVTLCLVLVATMTIVVQVQAQEKDKITFETRKTLADRLSIGQNMNTQTNLNKLKGELDELKELATEMESNKATQAKLAVQEFKERQHEEKAKAAEHAQKEQLEKKKSEEAEKQKRAEEKEKEENVKEAEVKAQEAKTKATVLEQTAKQLDRQQGEQVQKKEQVAKTQARKAEQESKARDKALAEAIRVQNEEKTKLENQQKEETEKIAKMRAAKKKAEEDNKAKTQAEKVELEKKRALEVERQKKKQAAVKEEGDKKKQAELEKQNAEQAEKKKKEETTKETQVKEAEQKTQEAKNKQKVAEQNEKALEKQKDEQGQKKEQTAKQAAKKAEEGTKARQKSLEEAQKTQKKEAAEAGAKKQQELARAQKEQGQKKREAGNKAEQTQKAARAQAALVRVRGVSIPANSMDAQCWPRNHKAFSIMASGPRMTFDWYTGIGNIVRTTDDAGFSLHDHKYKAANVPNPNRAVVTFYFTHEAVITGVDLVQHSNGITQLEAFVGNDESKLVSLGSVFGPKGDRKGSGQFKEFERNTFVFPNKKQIKGTILRVVIRKTSLNNGYAMYRMLPRTQMGVIPVQQGVGVASIAVPAGSQDGASSAQKQPRVDVPAYPLKTESGVGTLIDVRNRKNGQFTLHDHKYASAYVPRPARQTITYTLNMPTVIKSVTAEQHANGVTQIEVFVADSMTSRFRSIGKVFSNRGDLKPMFREHEITTFSFAKNRVAGTVVRIVIRKTRLNNGFALYRMILNDQNGPIRGVMYSVNDPEHAWDPSKTVDLPLSAPATQQLNSLVSAYQKIDMKSTLSAAQRATQKFVNVVNQSGNNVNNLKSNLKNIEAAAARATNVVKKVQTVKARLVNLIKRVKKQEAAKKVPQGTAAKLISETRPKMTQLNTVLKAVNRVKRDLKRVRNSIDKADKDASAPKPVPVFEGGAINMVANQRVSITNVVVNGRNYVRCTSLQARSTPGMVRRRLNLLPNTKYQITYRGYVSNSRMRACPYVGGPTGNVLWRCGKQHSMTTSEKQYRVTFTTKRGGAHNVGLLISGPKLDDSFFISKFHVRLLDDGDMMGVVRQANQRVTVTPTKLEGEKAYQVTSQQKGSSPGIFGRTKLLPNTRYEITIRGHKSARVKANICPWVDAGGKDVVWGCNAQRSLQNQVSEVTVPFMTNRNRNTQYRVGALFSNPQNQDDFYLRGVSIRSSESIYGVAGGAGSRARGMGAVAVNHQYTYQGSSWVYAVARAPSGNLGLYYDIELSPSTKYTLSVTGMRVGGGNYRVCPFVTQGKKIVAGTTCSPDLSFTTQEGTVALKFQSTKFGAKYRVGVKFVAVKGDLRNKRFAMKRLVITTVSTQAKENVHNNHVSKHIAQTTANMKKTRQRIALENARRRQALRNRGRGRRRRGGNKAQQRRQEQARKRRSRSRGRRGGNKVQQRRQEQARKRRSRSRGRRGGNKAQQRRQEQAGKRRSRSRGRRGGNKAQQRRQEQARKRRSRSRRKGRGGRRGGRKGRNKAQQRRQEQARKRRSRRRRR